MRMLTTGSCVAMFALLVMLTGCQPTPAAPVETEQSLTLDPTADQLHDICGSILLFHGAYHRMPQSLAELCNATSLPTNAVRDRSTGAMFDYKPSGFATLSDGGSVVLLAGKAPPGESRWGIAMSQSGPTPVCKVVSVPPAAVTSGPAAKQAAPSPATPPSRGPKTIQGMQAK